MTEQFAQMTGAPIDAKSVDLDALVEAYATARANRETISDAEKRARETEERAEALLFDAMESRNLSALRHRELGLFMLNDLPQPKVVDADALREWAIEAQPSLINVNRQSLGKLMRDAMKEGENPPPGVEAVFTRKISWRRGP